MASRFQLESPFAPTGDQPAAIAAIVEAFQTGRRYQVLEGVTGSGKTFTMANVIARLGRPTLVISHNKTLAAQLYAELKSFFPRNAVEYFISYYDYYQPEAYIPQTDTYIEKDASINRQIERFRLSATHALMSRQDVIVVASVSCIYGLGSPEDYRDMVVAVGRNDRMDRDALLRRLVEIQYERNDYELVPGAFRVRGDVVEVVPAWEEQGIRLSFFGDCLERLEAFDPLTGRTSGVLERVFLSPAHHFVMPADKRERAIGAILEELEERIHELEAARKLVEAQRLRQRTLYDVEMLRTAGYCPGIENYSRHLSGRKAGEPPDTLMDYFPRDFLTIVDESHVTVPQLRAMYNGDQARKTVLVEHGFRLPSAKDNRPLNFDEFLDRAGPILFVSATPGPFERSLAEPVRQLIRPTGLLDPPVIVRPLKGQVDDLMAEVRAHAGRGERVLVTTLTKKTAEDLARYLKEAGLRVQYLHSDITALERVDILRRLRTKEFDCLVGVNLLREGLDLPEVSLVAILDADKEGFLRSDTSLIQTAGRAARHVNGKVILYADTMTDSMKRLIAVTEERRAVQMEYNRRHGITPQSVQRERDWAWAAETTARAIETSVVRESGSAYEMRDLIEALKKEMWEAAEALEFERAGRIRDELVELMKAAGMTPPKEWRRPASGRAARRPGFGRSRPRTMRRR